MKISRTIIHLSSIITILALFIFSTAAFSENQAPDIETLLKRIEILEAEISSLKRLVKQYSAPASPAETSLQINGTAFISYSFDTDGPDRSDSRFTVDRWYFDTRKKLNGRMIARMTTDLATRVESSKTRFNTYVKYAYVQRDGVVPRGSLIFGSQPTVWVGGEEKAWRYRSIRKVLADERGFAGSGDFGVSLKGLFGDGKGDYHVMLANGEGYGAEEEAANANAKDLTARVSFAPWNSAPRFSLYGDLGSAGGGKSNRWGAMLDQNISGFSYGVSYIGGIDITKRRHGLSIFGNKDIRDGKWSVFGRHDRYDPDRSASGDIRTLFISGFAYAYSGNAKLIVSYQRDSDHSAATPSTKADSILAATMEIKY